MKPKPPDVMWCAVLFGSADDAGKPYTDDGYECFPARYRHRDAVADARSGNQEEHAWGGRGTYRVVKYVLAKEQR